MKGHQWSRKEQSFVCVLYDVRKFIPIYHNAKLHRRLCNSVKTMINWNLLKEFEPKSCVTLKCHVWWSRLILHCRCCIINITYKKKWQRQNTCHAFHNNEVIWNTAVTYNLIWSHQLGHLWSRTITPCTFPEKKYNALKIYLINILRRTSSIIIEQ